MGYAVLHMEKTSGTDAAMSAHIERTIHPKTQMRTERTSIGNLFGFLTEWRTGHKPYNIDWTMQDWHAKSATTK